jgi:hypothetical protein
MRSASWIISIAVLMTISALNIPTAQIIEAKGTQLRTNETIQTSSLCQPLPLPTGTIVQVSTVGELQSAVANLTSNTTILIADGTYDLSNSLIIDGGVPDVTIRGESGNRDAVVLRGRGMTNSSFGNTPHGFLIRRSNRVTIADLTIRDFYFHNIQIQGEQNAQATRLYNLKLVDSGEQLVKVSSGGPPAPYADDGIVECSYLGYTNRSRDWYTNGVDVLAGARWIIRDNVFENIRAPLGQLAGPAILMWPNSIDTIIERNLFIECDRAIAIGLSSPDPSRARDGNTQYDHQGGIVRNNIIFRAGSGDVGITANYARDFKIYHNTVILNNTFPLGTIEYRFTNSSGEISNNLTDGPIWRRDGANAALTGNVINAQLEWFVNAQNHDLHLAATAPVIDTVQNIPDVIDDFDGYTASCGTNPLVYCPLQEHTREEGTVFFLRMLHGAGYVPPEPTGIFADVPIESWGAKWIEAGYLEGLITACETSPDLKFCPADPLDRAMAAYMMVQAKGLGIP